MPKFKRCYVNIDGYVSYHYSSSREDADSDYAFHENDSYLYACLLENIGGKWVLIKQHIGAQI